MDIRTQRTWLAHQVRLRRLRRSGKSATVRVASCSIGARCTFEIAPGASLIVGESSNFLSDFHGVVHGALDVGVRVFFNRWCYLCCYASVRIGAGSIFGESVSIHDEDHEVSPTLGVTDKYNVKPVSIGAGVWVGSHVTILSGTTIGDRAVIGAGAVVRGTVPPDSLAVGVPARVVRTLTPGHMEG